MLGSAALLTRRLLLRFLYFAQRQMARTMTRRTATHIRIIRINRIIIRIVIRIGCRL